MYVDAFCRPLWKGDVLIFGGKVCEKFYFLEQLLLSHLL